VAPNDGNECIEVSAGDGENDIPWRESTVVGDLSIKAGRGDDTVDTTGSTIGGSVTISPAGGANTLIP
jgi:hypothetical protein